MYFWKADKTGDDSADLHHLPPERRATGHFKRNQSVSLSF